MAFTLRIEDVFSIAGRGTVVTGTVAGGAVRLGDTVFIIEPGGAVQQTIVTDISQRFNRLEVAEPGQDVGLLLRGIRREDVSRGDVLSHSRILPEPDPQPDPQPEPPPDPQPDPFPDPQPDPGPTPVAKLSLGARPSDAPALLLPLRIETAFVGNRLLVRAYPDQIHVDDFDPSLSDAEITLVKDAQSARTNGTPRAEVEARLTDAAGPNRALYLAEIMRNPQFETSVDRRGDIAFRNISLARALPEQLVAKAVSGDRTFFAQGHPIPPTLSLDAEAPWISDFAQAEKIGLGLSIALDAQAAREGIDALHVLGLNARPDAQDTLDALFRNHRRGQGLTTQPAYSYTLGGAAPGWGADRQDDKLAQALAMPLALTPKPDPAPLIRQIFAVLWQASLRPALQALYGLDDPQQLAAMQTFLSENLAPFGPYPTLKIGQQPYAVAPVTHGGDSAPLKGLSALFDQMRDALAQAAETARAGERKGSHYETMAATLMRAPIARHWRLRTLVPVRNVVGELLNATSQSDRQTVAGALHNARSTTRIFAQTLLGTRDALPRMGDWVPTGFAANVCADLVRPGAHRFTATQTQDVADRTIAELLENPAFWSDRIDGQRTTTPETVPHAPVPPDGEPEPVWRLYAENAVLQVLSDYALAEDLRPVDEGARRALARLADLDADTYGEIDDWFLRHHLAHTTQAAGNGAALQDLASSLRPRTAEGDRLRGEIAQLAKALETVQRSDAHAVHVAFAAMLDCFSNRPDVWDMMTADTHLQTLRNDGDRSLAVGGWGHVEDIRPSPADREATYLCAPSVKLATLLCAIDRARSGLAASGLPDLVSGRFDGPSVARAKTLIDAFGAGGAPDMVLSRLACTALQDRGAADRIPDLVKQFPLTGAGDPGTASAFDGLRFVSEDLPPDLGADVRGVQQEMAQMVDDLGHILLADATGALADRQIDRAKAALEGLGVGARPQSDAAALGPAPTGISLSFSVALLTDGDGAQPGPVDLSARLSPRLASVAARALGPMAGHIALGSGIDAKRATFDSLSISALSLALLASTGAPPRETIETHIRLRHNVDKVRFDDHAAATIWAAAALGQAMREARTLRPEDLPDQAQAQVSSAALMDDLVTARRTLANLAARLGALLAEDPKSPQLDARKKTIAADVFTLGVSDTPDPDRLSDALDRVQVTLARAEAAESDEDALAILLGALPRILPLTTPRVEPWQSASALTGASANALALWLEDSQLVRPRLQGLADVLLGRDQPPLAALQWHDGGRVASLAAPIDWIGAPLAEDDVYLTDETIVAIGASPSLSAGTPFGGLLVDNWRETIPDRTVSPALTTDLPAPQARAPQALLLAVPRQRGAVWTAADLFALAEKTVATAKARVSTVADLPDGSQLPRALRDAGLVAPVGALRSNETALTRAACPPREEG